MLAQDCVLHNPLEHKKAKDVTIFYLQHLGVALTLSQNKDFP